MKGRSGIDLGPGSGAAPTGGSASATSVPPPPPGDPSADPAIAALRRVGDEVAASAHAIGELLTEAAPAYPSETAAAVVLAQLCAAIGEDLESALAARRYAMSGDRRALHGTVL
ncbi:hypothetical protein ACMATS_37770 (plasmid) [Streptoverticillium reticulum]|uniref:hypothetical protein n=1 Tax=Streptoverticillium reticulum TaxID=1433415 RepID=UPI0039BF2DF3